MYKNVFHEFKKALGPRGDTAQSLYSLGVVSAVLSRSKEAKQYYRRAQQLRPDYWEAHYSLGVLLEGEGRIPAAIGELELAREGMPDSLCISRTLIRVYQSAGDSEKVIDTYRVALANTANRTQACYLHHELGRAYCALGRYDKAIIELREASRLKPSDPYLRVNLGTAYLVQGRSKEAAYELERALEIKPDLLSALRNLGTLYVRTEQFSRAIEMLEKAAEIAPAHASTLRKLAVAYHHSGDDRRAQDLMKRAIELDELQCGGTS